MFVSCAGKQCERLHESVRLGERVPVPVSGVFGAPFAAVLQLPPLPLGPQNSPQRREQLPKFGQVQKQKSHLLMEGNNSINLKHIVNH